MNRLSVSLVVGAGVILASLCSPSPISAQVDVTTTDGVVNHIPIWTTVTNIETSQLSQKGTLVTASGALGSVTDLRVDVDGKNDASTPGATNFVSPGLRFGTSSTTEPTGEAITSQRVTCVSTGCTNNVNGLDLDTNFVAQLSITNGGFVGIHTRTPSNVFTIEQGAGPAIADGWDTYSSRRWKTNIHTLEGALEKVEQLRGVSYDLQANGKHEVGVIAEEVGAVVPEVVTWEKNGKDARSVDYGRLTALLIEATKEQQTLIHEQQQQLETQKAQIAELTSHVKTVEAALQASGQTGAGVRTVKAQLGVVRQ